MLGNGCCRGLRTRSARPVFAGLSSLGSYVVRAIDGLSLSERRRRCEKRGAVVARNDETTDCNRILKLSRGMTPTINSIRLSARRGHARGSDSTREYGGGKSVYRISCTLYNRRVSQSGTVVDSPYKRHNLGHAELTRRRSGSLYVPGEQEKVQETRRWSG